MTGIFELLEDVLRDHGWSVRRPNDDDRLDGFSLIAENEIAVVFASSTTAERLLVDSQRLGAQVGRMLQSGADAKAWEGYLLLVVPKLTEADSSAIAAVQRDLTYCRRVVVEAAALVTAPTPSVALGTRLAFLFPMTLTEVNPGPDAEQLLRDQLAARGTPLQMIDGLLGGIDDPEFDPVDFLRAFDGQVS